MLALTCLLAIVPVALADATNPHLTLPLPAAQGLAGAAQALPASEVAQVPAITAAATDAAANIPPVLLSGVQGIASDPSTLPAAAPALADAVQTQAASSAGMVSAAAQQAASPALLLASGAGDVAQQEAARKGVEVSDLQTSALGTLTALVALSNDLASTAGRAACAAPEGLRAQLPGLPSCDPDSIVGATVTVAQAVADVTVVSGHVVEGAACTTASGVAVEAAGSVGMNTSGVPCPAVAPMPQGVLGRGLGWVPEGRGLDAALSIPPRHNVYPGKAVSGCLGRSWLCQPKEDVVG